MPGVSDLLLAFDIDGTLVTEPSQSDSPSERTIHAIRAAAEQGAIIAVFTPIPPNAPA
eukprot:COSAG02_NODE_1241_length_13704_cov_3.128188_9_plen_58_part_00